MEENNKKFLGLDKSDAIVIGITIIFVFITIMFLIYESTHDPYSIVPADDTYDTYDTNLNQNSQEDIKIIHYNNENECDYLKNLPEYQDASLSFSFIKEYAKLPSNFTEGLYFYNGNLFESCGLYGESKITTGISLISDDEKNEVGYPRDLERHWGDKYFLEGSSILNDKLYCLTYKENTCFIVDPENLKDIDNVYYPYEGWGLTTDGKSTLYASDGSSSLHVLDEDLNDIKTLTCMTSDGIEITGINELEYVDGKIYANMFTTDYILVIDAEDGKIETIYDFGTSIPSRKKSYDKNNVLNGIAYNPDTDTFLITGKRYLYYYEFKLK